MHSDMPNMLSVHLYFKNKWHLFQLADQETSQPLLFYTTLCAK